MKKIAVFTLLSILIFTISGCHSRSDNGTGDIKDVKSYMNAVIKDKVTDVELIHTEIIPERIERNELVVDGATFYNGKDETIPEHSVQIFRAFSNQLDSYVYLIFNGHTKKYSLVQNYDVAEEKQGALALTSILKEMMEVIHIPFITLNYCKFDHETLDLNDAYKLSADYDASHYVHTGPLWIIIAVDAPANDIRVIKDRVQERIDALEATISVDIKTSDGRTITFYKHGQPLIDDDGTGGLKSYF